MSHSHEKVVCSCGRIMFQCRCIEGGRNVRTVVNGCEECKRRLSEGKPDSEPTPPTCKCGHSRRDHEIEPPYYCQMICADGDGCECEGYTIPTKAVERVQPEPASVEPQVEPSRHQTPCKVWEEDGKWFVHALAFDIVTHGTSKSLALDSMSACLHVQIDFGLRRGLTLRDIYFAAPPVDWQPPFHFMDIPYVFVEVAADSVSHPPLEQVMKYLCHTNSCGRGGSIADSLAGDRWENSERKWRDCTCGLAAFMLKAGRGRSDETE